MWSKSIIYAVYIIKGLHMHQNFILKLFELHRHIQFTVMSEPGELGASRRSTLKSLIEEHARLDFSDFLPPCLQFFM